ncbi:hypothetical protein JXQ70_00045 [bacterium]|nr:hypothetical protein [bacterium]
MTVENETDNPERSGSIRTWLLALLGLILLGLSLTLNVRSPFPYFYFFSDEATYYSMTYSLAYDQDLDYTREDLERVCFEWADGPTGIFLKKTETGRITFGKSYLYPLLAAIPVRLFGSNGFLMLNLFCFWFMVFMGSRHLCRQQTPLMSFLFAFLYFFLSTTWVFVFWVHPEITVMTLIMTALFLWFDGPYRTVVFEWARLAGIALCLGLATFAKITNAIFLVPILLDLVLTPASPAMPAPRPSWKRHLPNSLKSFGLLMLCVLTVWSLFGFNKISTGDWNYQWGERKGFAREFPFEEPDRTFDSLGSPATRENLVIKTEPLLLLRNFYYFIFGRFGGMLPYFLPALLALALFFRGPRQRRQWLLLIAFGLQQLFFFIFLTDNYIGGMGTIGNRYFLNAFPLFLFLIPRTIPRSWVLIMVVIASFFLLAVNLNPFAQSFQPAEHTFSLAYRLLPVELTQIDFLPVHINHHLSRRAYELEPFYRLTFLDYQTYLPETNGFWLRPGPPAQVLLETRARAGQVRVSVTNGARPNHITIKIDESKIRLDLGPRETRTFNLALEPDYVHNNWFIHTVTCSASHGFIPRFHEEGNQDRRYLGCFITLELLE